MRLMHNNNSLFRIFATLFSLIAWTVTLDANAAKPTESSSKKAAEQIGEYEVKNGDTLGAIADEHDVDLEELMKINDIDDPDKVWAGRKLQLPGADTVKKKAKGNRGVTIEIPKGFSLSRIASAYEISLATLISANKLTNPDRIRAGQKLFIPGAAKVIELVPPPPCFKDPITLYRVRTDETQIVPLSFCSGKTNPEGLETLSKISAPPHKEMPFGLHPRLAQLLQRVSDRFPGKRVEIISAQRLPRQKGNESYHNTGRAIDFRMEGVSNKELSTFIRTFQNVGVGYYPNSVFVHMDTREDRAYWVDYSRPGEKAIYARSGTDKKEIEKIRNERQEKQTEEIISEVDENIEDLIHSLAMNDSAEPQD